MSDDVLARPAAIAEKRPYDLPGLQMRSCFGLKPPIFLPQLHTGSPASRYFRNCGGEHDQMREADTLAEFLLSLAENTE
jgi:hypothetical protein